MKRSSGSQQCHHVSKILERQMQPQDQLASDFGKAGLDLEAEFEKDLKDVLGFHEASERGFWTLPLPCSEKTEASQPQDSADGTLAWTVNCP
ncbi:PREDICTED: sp110 nuclear body protein-like isoform X1 [Mandrillus leucophaeus]|uniref:sp110 nuclear body protein-like isoform X1 n=1 Tax=Mandrillus leucophaeus TaxID=9568 RepID=UPI0005F4B44E|nr:PREDICTED: sp110 nuclear body protein-like isoform X1 [Mandrillus leucophaeus]